MFKRRHFLLTVVALLLGAFGGVEPLHPAPFQPGQIFVAYGGSNIGVFADTVSLTGTPIQTLSVPLPGFLKTSGLGGGGGLTLDEEGNLYATLSDNNRTVGLIKFRASDGSQVFAKTYTISGVDDFRSLVAKNGRIYVATDRGIRVFDAATGERISTADFGGTLAYRDLAFDSQGNLYAVRETGDGRLVIRRWASGSYSGLGSVVFSSGTYVNSDPRALVMDGDGNIYITLNLPKAVIKVRPDPVGGTDETRDIGTVLARYDAPLGIDRLIGLDYDPGVQKLFASHTGTGIGQILALDPKTGSWTAFGPNNLTYARWLAVYPTPEPATVVLLLVGLGFMMRKRKRNG